MIDLSPFMIDPGPFMMVPGLFTATVTQKIRGTQNLTNVHWSCK